MTLEELEQIVATRAAASPDESWTAKLLAKGPEKVAEKFGEEAIEAEDLGALIVTIDGFSKDRAVYFESERKVALRIFTEVQQLATKLDSKKLWMTEFTEMNFLIYLGDNLRHVYQNIY